MLPTFETSLWSLPLNLASLGKTLTLFLVQGSLLLPLSQLFQGPAPTITKLQENSCAAHLTHHPMVLTPRNYIFLFFSRNVQVNRAGQGLEQPGLVEGAQGMELGDFYKSFPAQTIPFCHFLFYFWCSFCIKPAVSGADLSFQNLPCIYQITLISNKKRNKPIFLSLIISFISYLKLNKAIFSQ